MMVTILSRVRTCPPRAMCSYVAALPPKRCACRALIAAVRVVLPWSMCPMVPTLTCGLVLVKTSLAIVPPQVQNGVLRRQRSGVQGGDKSVTLKAAGGSRTHDLFITNEALYH